MLINYKEQRKLMVYLMKELQIKDKKVLKAMLKIPREEFVPEILKESAYENIPLSIGSNQTISQPYTVAFMLELLEVKKGNKVLEIGTGSGYNAALLSELTGKDGKVITIETIEKLYENSKDLLKNYKNIEVIHSDGSLGYKKESPYDRIIVTAGCPVIPNLLINQLKNNGILICPVGSPESVMLKIIKTDNSIKKEVFGYFYFVPLRGEAGFN